MPSNELELVICLPRNWTSGQDENAYTSRQASAICEWSLILQRLDMNDFRLALTCDQTTLTSTNVVLYIENCYCFHPRNFVELNDISIQPGAVVWSKERFTIEKSVRVIGARISMHGSQRASIPSVLPECTYEFADRCPACDVQIRVVDRVFYANKGVLSVVSPVFCAMFNGEFREKYRDELVLEEVEPEVFEAFLKAVYPNGDEPAADNLAGLMELAERYDEKFLRNSCERICRQRTDIPLLDRLKFAVHYRLNEFEDLLIQSMDAAAARQLASEENLESLGVRCMKKLFVKSAKLST